MTTSGDYVRRGRRRGRSVGGGAFERNDELDRRLLAEVGRRSCRHAADGRRLRAARPSSSPRRRRGRERLGVDLEALMVMQRHDADDGAAATIDRRARRSTSPATPRCTCAACSRTRPCSPRCDGCSTRGGLVVAIGPSAAALSDPMFDVRGGAFTLGLGLETGVAIIPESEKWSEEALGRTRSLATTPVIALPTGSAAVSRGGRWQLIGAAESSGDLRLDTIGPVAAPSARRRWSSRRVGSRRSPPPLAYSSPRAPTSRPLPRASWWPDCRRHHRRRRRWRRARRRSRARAAIAAPMMMPFFVIERRLSCFANSS